MSDKTREAFEAWAISEEYSTELIAPPIPTYDDPRVQAAWNAWDYLSASHAEEVKRLREALENLSRGIGTCPCRPLAAVHGATEVDAWWMEYIAGQDEWVRSIARAALQGDK